MDLSESYNQVAKEYADRLFDELRGKPKDREYLDQFLRLVGTLGPICDVGCGPGQVARHLRDRGYKDVFGIDLSPGMIHQARLLNPDIKFEQGDMLSLDAPNQSWGGIAAFYSIIHIPKDLLRDCFQEFYRVLCPEGVCLISFHIGDETVHLDEWWGKKVSADFNFLPRDEIEALLKSVGFTIEYSVERDPYPPDVEHQSRRAYIFARKNAINPSGA